MARLARIVPGFSHHVTQRGNRRQVVFCTDDERRRYLALLLHYAPRYGLRILAYCLMDNHVHWVVIPEREPALAQTLGDAHTAYAAGWNATHRLTGTSSRVVSFRACWMTSTFGRRCGT